VLVISGPRYRKDGRMVETMNGAMPFRAVADPDAKAWGVTGRCSEPPGRAVEAAAHGVLGEEYVGGEMRSSSSSTWLLTPNELGEGGSLDC
jgi:hypothetical protein